MKPKVSVIVAVYNIEKYITKCLDSLKSQTLKEAEFIIVDDGSNDSCPKICDEYPPIDNRFRIIHKNNGGLWSARQIGLENSTGEYILACDGDDWLEPNMCEILYNVAQSNNNLDVVSCGYYYDYNTGETVPHFIKEQMTDSEQILNKVLCGQYPPMVWNKLIKRDFLFKNNIFWYPGINMGEDIFLFIRILMHNPKICSINIPLYHYLRRIGENSYTNTITLCTFKQMEFYRVWIEDNLDCKKYGRGIFNMWINLAFTGLRTKEMNNSIFIETLSHIKWINFIKYPKINAKYALVFVSKLCGFNIGKSIMDRLYSILQK